MQSINQASSQTEKYIFKTVFEWSSFQTIVNGGRWRRVWVWFICLLCLLII